MHIYHTSTRRIFTSTAYLLKNKGGSKKKEVKGLITLLFPSVIFCLLKTSSLPNMLLYGLVVSSKYHWVRCYYIFEHAPKTRNILSACQIRHNNILYRYTVPIYVQYIYGHTVIYFFLLQCTARVVLFKQNKH